MAVVEELLRSEANGKISFGNHKLGSKTKLDDFQHEGDLYKVKTYADITKLEKNGLFLYESVPGTSVFDFEESVQGVNFRVEGDKDAQITVGLEDETEYKVYIDNECIGNMKTGFGGKLSFSVELEASDDVAVKVVRA